MRQASNLERLLCNSKFMPAEESFDVNFCGNNWVYCLYLLKASFCLFKKVNKFFFLKNDSNCESRNLMSLCPHLYRYLSRLQRRVY